MIILLKPSFFAVLVVLAKRVLLESSQKQSTVLIEQRNLKLVMNVNHVILSTQEHL